MAEDTGDDAKAAWTVYAPAGLDIWNTVTASGTGGVKAMLETDDYLYVVAGRKVSAIDLFGVVTLVTTLPSDGQAFLARNRRSPTPEVCLVSDGVGYIITGTSISVPAVRASSVVVVLNLPSTGAVNPPLAPSTWMSTSRPVRSWRSSSAAAIAATSS